MAENFLEEEKIKSFEEFRHQVISIISNYSEYKKVPIYDPNENGFTLAIDSSWGTGKTTFLQRLEYRINNETIADPEKGIKAIYYNAWENDGFGNSLVPIVYKLHELLDEKDKKYSELNKGEQLLEKSKKIFKGLIKTTSKITINIPTIVGIEANIGEITKSLKESFSDNPEWHNNDTLTDYINYIKIKEEFHELLNKFKPLSFTKMVIIIDELDRCRPTFAIETLEAIKHFFNLENIIFIFAVDIEQLSHSIATMYGSNMDASGYLRRFFDLQIAFPPIPMEEFIKLQFLNDEILRKRKTIQGLTEISSQLNLSLREIEKFISHLRLLYKINIKPKNYDPDYKTNAVMIYFFLIIISLKYNDFWKGLCSGKLSSTDVDKFIQEINRDIYGIPAKYFIDESIQPPLIYSKFLRLSSFFTVFHFDLYKFSL